MANLETIRALFTSGRHQECIQACQAVLQQNPEETFALKYAGKSLLALGQIEQAQNCLAKAHQLDPSDPETVKDIGNCLMAKKDLGGALRLYEHALAIDTRHAPALNNIGVILKEDRQLSKAADFIARAIGIDPSFGPYHMNLGSILKEQGQLDQALAATLKAIELKPDQAEAHMNLGGILKDQGQLDQALAATLKAIELKPDHADAHVNLGGILKEQGQLDQALAATLKAIELKPDHADAHINLGGILKEQGKLNEANKAVGMALDLTQSDCSRVAQILSFYDDTNQEQELVNAINRLKSLISGFSLGTQIYESRVLFRSKDYDRSWDLISSVETERIYKADWFTRIKYHAFRGAAAEKIGRHEEAFTHFGLSQLEPAYQHIDYEYEHRRILEYITLAESIKRGNPGLPNHISTSSKEPIFLIGFPRSGTTLLDTVLRSHSDIEVLEEKDPLALTEGTAMLRFNRRIQDLASLRESELNLLRETYENRLNKFATGNCSAVIDKLPLHTIALPLINLLFPKAKVIVAVRHPCDSVLSCFQQTFKPNPAMANFTTLEKTVNFYDKVMNGFRIYTEQLSIDYTTIRYEDLLNDFQRTATDILRFLDLDWQEELHDYRETAMRRGYIRTPSASQVIQPIYKSSMRRWENYRSHFQEHMSKLDQWIKYWQYSQ